MTRTFGSSGCYGAGPPDRGNPTSEYRAPDGSALVNTAQPVSNQLLLSGDWGTF